MISAIKSSLSSFVFSEHPSTKWHSHLVRGLIGGGVAVTVSVIARISAIVSPLLQSPRQSFASGITGGAIFGGIFVFEMLREAYFKRQPFKGKELPLLMVPPIFGVFLGCAAQAILKTLLVEETPIAMGAGFFTGVCASIVTQKKEGNLIIEKKGSIRAKNLNPILAGSVAGAATGGMLGNLVFSGALIWILQDDNKSGRKWLFGKLFCSMLLSAAVGSFFQDFKLRTLVALTSGCIAAKIVKDYAAQKILEKKQRESLILIHPERFGFQTK